ncbi:hypothetical protein BZA77DRAFT_325266 [Pyronema omphalodes]|nr:hypothetical protein BZA77DRAFT_325266 [Pyronema omphalodes]
MIFLYSRSNSCHSFNFLLLIMTLDQFLHIPIILLQLDDQTLDFLRIQQCPFQFREGINNTLQPRFQSPQRRHFQIPIKLQIRYIQDDFQRLIIHLLILPILLQSQHPPKPFPPLQLLLLCTFPISYRSYTVMTFQPPKIRKHLRNPNQRTRNQQKPHIINPQSSALEFIGDITGEILKSLVLYTELVAVGFEGFVGGSRCAKELVPF